MFPNLILVFDQRRAEHYHPGPADEFERPKSFRVFTLQNESEAPLLVRVRTQSRIGPVPGFRHHDVGSLCFALHVVMTETRYGSLFHHTITPVPSLV